MGIGTPENYYDGRLRVGDQSRALPEREHRRD
jgi:hypothetical protein